MPQLVGVSSKNHHVPVGGVEGAGKTILFRAALDGLPIQEVLEVPRPKPSDGGSGDTKRVRRKHTWEDTTNLLRLDLENLLIGMLSLVLEIEFNTQFTQR